MGVDGRSGQGKAHSRRHACMAAGQALAAVAIGGGWPAAALAQLVLPPSGCVRLPFELKPDLDVVRGLVQTPPAQLLGAIRGLGVDVLRVSSSKPEKPVNPLLAALSAAPAALLAEAEFQNSYQGRAIPRGSPCCRLARDTVLIRDTAPTYTLLHEVLHLLLVPADGQALRLDVELRFNTALRRLTLYQRRLYDDPWRLQQPAWRADILAAQRDLADLLYDRIRIGQSQEAAIEQVLRSCVAEASPYFDESRRTQGQRYGEAMVDNAVDLFNLLNDSLYFCRETVRNLREEIAAGRLAETTTDHLSARDAADFDAAGEAIRGRLTRVRQAIEALERLYDEP